ncbi:MAG: aminotransferase class V-fold PLP-dependent enzyme [Proteobacteria bacterium]|nr:aminotransferase class V-fold PLP-dependent enzyme [Pseudomonadota bacterium]MBI3498850.1 aminotransferase class V-fold PLP-dependent enzyme [Pseudomonadota bacterium]
MTARAARANDAYPDFGSAIQGAFALDPEVAHLNHGSFGATPRKVMAAQDEWRRRMELSPTGFFSRELPGALRHAAQRLAGYVGARGEDLAFVDNATTGAAAVLWSLGLAPGDEVLINDQTYNAVKNAVRHVVDRAGASMVTVTLPFPVADADEILAAFTAGLTSLTKLAIIDHITSPTAIVMPIRRMVEACRKAGVPVFVDGAHGPGQVPLDLGALGADWYTGNAHKWLCAPKGAALFWARADRQAGLHPAVISHGYGSGFAAEFDWTGTRDPSAYLAVPAALDFREALGDERVRRYNHELVLAAAEALARRWGTQTGAPCELTGSMAVVRLPERFAPERVSAAAVRSALARDWRIEVPLNRLAGALWVRISAQVYNEMADYHRLGEAIERMPDL